MGVHLLRLGLGLRWVVLGVVCEVGWQSQGRGGWQRTRRRTQSLCAGGYNVSIAFSTDKLSDQDYTTRPYNQRFTVSRPCYQLPVVQRGPAG